ncbi:MAG TPA: hypothetical protein VFX30_13830 [bacterium]|nr:hypothetical protein [bacterium]
MTCRTIDQGVLDSSKSLEDVYSQLGVLRNPADASVLAPPVVILPDGIAQAAFPYLEGAEGRDFNLSGLFGDNKEGLNCVLSSLHYDERRAAEIAAEVGNIEQQGGSVEDYLATLGVGDRRSYSIYTTLDLLDYFRGTARDGRSGNIDGRQDIISLNELSTWAWEACGKTTPENQQKVAETAIARFHALLGLAVFLQSEPDKKRADNDSNTAAAGTGSPKWEALVSWVGRNWIYGALFGGSVGLGFLIRHFSKKTGWREGFRAGFTKGRINGEEPKVSDAIAVPKPTSPKPSSPATPAAAAANPPASSPKPTLENVKTELARLDEDLRGADGKSFNAVEENNAYAQNVFERVAKDASSEPLGWKVREILIADCRAWESQDPIANERYGKKAAALEEKRQQEREILDILKTENLGGAK